MMQNLVLPRVSGMCFEVLDKSSDWPAQRLALTIIKLVEIATAIRASAASFVQAIEWMKKLL